MVKLKDICYKITDGSHNPPQGIAKSNYLMLSSKNVYDDLITFDEPRYLTEKDFLIENRRTNVSSNDIILTIVGTIGRVAVVPETAPKLCLQRSVAILKPDLSIVIPRFLMYQLQNLRPKLEAEAKGVAQKGIYLKQVESLEISSFSLDRQKEIVYVLDEISKLISLRKKQLQKLDDLVKSRFVEMFGDPEANPKEWVKKPLAEVITAANNGMARRGNDEHGNIVMRLVELQDGYIDYTNPNRIILTDAEKKRYLLKDKDFLFARVNGNPDNVGRCAVFADIGEPVYHNDHIIRVHFDENRVDGTFASALLNSAYGKKQLKNQIKTSAGQYTVSQEGIGAIDSIFPPIELQKKFAHNVEMINKSKQRIRLGLDKLEQMKQALMQKFFG